MFLVQKLFSGRLSWFLDLKIDFENWKCQIFDKSASSCLTRYRKILWGSSLEYQKNWNSPASLWNSTTVTTQLNTLHIEIAFLDLRGCHVLGCLAIFK